jgi:hypothetical protein
LVSKLLVFVALPLVFTTLGLAYYARDGVLAIDFHRQYWVVGRRVLDGLSPYDRGWQDITHGVGFPYTALDALVFAPFALLPHTAADWVFTGLTLAAGLGTLWVLGVRDVRLYGLILLWAPVVSAWQTANLTLLLGLGIAWAWRLRDRAAAVGTLVGLLVVAKLFVWPLGIWLVATRRYAALGYALVVGAVLNVVGWAVIGFDQISAYRDLSRDITRLDVGRSYNLVHLMLSGGAGHDAAYGLQTFAAIAGCGCCIALGRAGRDQSALIVSVAVALLAAPVIWLHYFALLMVPLALTTPSLSAVWIAPIALFVCPVNKPSVAEVWVTLGIACLVFAWALRRADAGVGASERAASLTA